MNYFPTYPVQAESCKEHSAPLAEMVNTCYKAAGNVLPNFIAINFYMVIFIAQDCKLELIHLYPAHTLLINFSIFTET